MKVFCCYVIYVTLVHIYNVLVSMIIYLRVIGFVRLYSLKGGTCQAWQGSWYWYPIPVKNHVYDISQLWTRTLQYFLIMDSIIWALHKNLNRIRKRSLSFPSCSIIEHGLDDVQNGTSINLIYFPNNQWKIKKSSSTNIIPNDATQDVNKV